MKWLLFAIGAALFWGCYGPTIHEGQLRLGKSALRAFVCVGGAYFLVAVLLPTLVMVLDGKTEPGKYTAGGTSIATLAGILGALGAICVIWAFLSGGKPVYVMPIVFAGAPIVNALASMVLHPPKQSINPLFFAGMLLAAIGAGMVLYYKPAGGPPKKPDAAVTATAPSGLPDPNGAGGPEVS